MRWGRIFETERLVLRPLAVEHAEQTLEYALRNQSFHAPWEPDRNAPHYTLKGQRALLRRSEKGWRDQCRFMFWLLPREGGRVIGNIHYFSVIRGFFRTCLMSYALDCGEVRQGLMSEALPPTMEYMFSDQGMRTLEANVMPANTASLALLRKFGFRRAGVNRNYLEINGVAEDHIRMTKTRDE